MIVGTVALLAGCAPDPPSAVVGIVVEGCGPGVDHGTGAFVGDDLVLTAAHTLRGAETITVTDGTHTADATVVGFDPDLDLAYLRADLGPIRPLVVDSSALEAGDTGSVWVFRDGRPDRLDATVARRVVIRTEDVYVEGATERPGLDLVADIEAGDSGGPVVVDGRIVGIVWAQSREAAERAYAIDPDRGRARIDEQLRTGDLGDVDVTRCS